MTTMLIGALLAAGGALAGIAVDRALLRRWISSHGTAGRRHDPTDQPGTRHSDDTTGQPGARHRDDTTGQPGARHRDDTTGQPGARHRDDVTGQPGARHRDDVIGGSGASRRPSVRQAVEACERRAARADAQRSAAEVAAARIEASLDALRTGVVVCDRDGNVMARNSVATEIVQARHGEALVAGVVKELLERARHGERAATDVELRAEPRRSYEVEARPIERHGEMLGAVALVRDTTEQHRAESVRRDFVANVSHELKTPIGALSLLADSLSSDADPEVLDRLTGRIQIEIQRVAGTIDDLLTLAGLEDRSTRRGETVRIDEVVDGALSRIAETAEQKGVDVVVSGRDAAASVRGSRIELESALFNLLDNAVKFSEPGGRVAVAVAREQQRLVVSVADQGIGIPAGEQSRIFERFYRVDRARSRHTGGTGLGLSIVRHAVLNHGGEVSVTSREGFGAKFTIALPLPADD